VIFIVGVNGAGKATSIGKRCEIGCAREGSKAVILCGRRILFRAAAAKQARNWGRPGNGIGKSDQAENPALTQQKVRTTGGVERRLRY